MNESEKSLESSHSTLKDYYKSIKTELPQFIPIAYLCIIGIGMVFNYHKYIHFGINIFQYASVFDFLISPFEDYIIILFTLFSLFIPFFLYYTDCLLENKHPKIYRVLSFNMNKKVKYPLFRFGILAFSVFAYIWIMSSVYGKHAYQKVLDQQDIIVRYTHNGFVVGKQIGKTNDILFLLTEDGKTKAIPIHSSVTEIIYNP